MFGGSVDVFVGSLTGLVLAEIECADEAAFAAVIPPQGTIAAVTQDDRFSGGSLATLDRRALVVLLGEFAAP